MTYRCLTLDHHEQDTYEILTIRREDIFQIKNWRNEQMSVLRQNQLLTDEDQLRYYETAIRSSMEAEQPKIILFSYLQAGACIGYGGLTNIDWVSKRAEISFLVATERTQDDTTYARDFSTFLHLMQQVAFAELGFHRLFTETFDARSKHIAILESSGFQREGRLRQHVWMDGRFVDSIMHGCLREDARHVEG